ncbi:hypothetical protein TNCV_3619241 [Trichonephila clavipes]|nr:hypothetical protein TNCV_3619241 [Trichonephila clavipes]
MIGGSADIDICKIPLSNDTIHRGIKDLSENIEQNTAKTLANSNFALQVDETTDITENAQLIAFKLVFSKSGQIFPEKFGAFTAVNFTYGISLRQMPIANAKVQQSRSGSRGICAATDWSVDRNDATTKVVLESRYECPKCGKNMVMRERKGTIDGYEWRCRTKGGENPHDVCKSIRKGSKPSHWCCVEVRRWVPAQMSSSSLDRVSKLKKAVLEWCLKEGLIGSSYVCPKCGKGMELSERTGTVFSFLLWGCGSPVVKVSDQGSHVMSSSPVPLKTRHAVRRVVLLVRWIVRSVPLEIVGRSGHEKAPTRGNPGLERPGRSRGSKDRVTSTCGPHSDSFNDTSRRRRINCSTNNFQTPCRNKS